jgi:basic membrane protein A and related proteins
MVKELRWQRLAGSLRCRRRRFNNGSAEGDAMTGGGSRKWSGFALAAALTIGVAVASGTALGQNQLKVGAVFETPIEEPWVNQIHVALLRAKEEFGIAYTWSESVSASDFARVLREYAEQDHNLIMGDSFGTERITRRVARDYPEVAFAFGSGIGPAEPNFAVFDNWIHEPAYLAGMIAGKLSASNVVGVVAAMPIPEVNRLSNAFCAGAKEVNEAVRCKFSFIGSFFDPPKAKEAAIAQIEAGVDVIYGERFGVIEAAAERGIPAIGNMSDQSELAPETVVTSVVWDMWPTVKQVVGLVQAGVFTSQDFGQFSFMGKGGSYLAPYHAWDAKLPNEIKAMVGERTQEIMDGTFRVPVDESTPRSE